ncbi:c-type cytochrome biogenesis protein CcsB [Luteococcus peritonei]|uniref:C-type cytochrome biogenesis protein CcsB n=1 Tax=Luteococcus peritonei TaxID=88874 RepID=A0ABW4RYZ5_9ACTN
MLDLSQYCAVAAAMLTAIASVAFIASQTTTRRVAVAPAGGPGGTADVTTAARGVSWYATKFTQLAFALLTASLVLRWIVVKHAPYANQYEFACSFAWGMLAVFVYFEARHHARSLGLALLPMTLAMLLYAETRSAEVAPLVPALQHPLMLTTHVLFAVLGYGAAAVASAAGILYLIKPRVKWAAIPSLDRIDELGYRAVVFAFPLLTVMNIQGAIWANIAWGRYWSWDPKETAALMTWLIYGAYIHARVTKDWRGSRSAWLLILGFVAVLFTFFGNHWFGGLHSYG